MLLYVWFLLLFCWQRVFSCYGKPLRRHCAYLRIAPHSLTVHYRRKVPPHQHLHGLTSMKAWRGIDPYRQPPKAAYLFLAWDGLLARVHLRR